jgi:hypothetical protein
MFVEQEAGVQLAELGQALERVIERQIVQRTWGRVKAVKVEVADNRVIVRGRAPSYYLEQLALRGVLEVIQCTGAMRIELNIQVGSPPKSVREALESSQETDRKRSL